MDLAITCLEGPSPGALPLELVERKGLGHPDTVCDALAENLSRALSRAYLQRFGVILHHNVDKALLLGGTARPAFGGGEVTAPIEIILAGRATTAVRGVSIPVEEIAIEESRRWLTMHLRHLDVDRHVRIVPRLRPTSPDLSSLFLRHAAGVARANDTSIGVGFAPLDELERTVLGVERRLTSLATRDLHPEAGEDVKVMGVRRGRRIVLTVGWAIVDRFVVDLADYRRKKERLVELVLAAARETASGQVEVTVNAADGETMDSVYLTVTGLSAEAGDDGQVGRGNRVNGLITPYRPMTLEAAAGKNPVSHVGKLYNIVADRTAQALLREVPGVREASCALVSCIGRPINEPQAVDVKVRLDEPARLETLRPRLAEVARAQVATVSSLWREVVEGRVDVW